MGGGLCLLAIAFVFDPQPVETLCRECCWLGREVGALVWYSCLWIQFALGGVVSLLGVRYEKIAVVVPS